MNKKLFSIINKRSMQEATRFPLIETFKLFDDLKNKKTIKILNSSFVVPPEKIDRNIIFREKRIPGAINFDLDYIR